MPPRATTERSAATKKPTVPAAKRAAARRKPNTSTEFRSSAAQRAAAVGCADDDGDGACQEYRDLQRDAVILPDGAKRNRKPSAVQLRYEDAPSTDSDDEDYDPRKDADDDGE